MARLSVDRAGSVIAGWGLDPSKVYVCHAPEDMTAARELAAALIRLGHSVWLDDQPGPIGGSDIPGLEELDGVVVVWSEASIASARVQDIANRALQSKRLICVHVEAFPATRMPPPFDTMIAVKVSDVEGICNALLALKFGLKYPSQTEVPQASPRGVTSDSAVLSSPTPRNVTSDSARLARLPEIDTSLFDLRGRQSPRRVGAAERTPDVGAGGRPRDDRRPLGVGAGTGPTVKPEGIGAAGTVRATPPPSALREQQALGVQAGRLVHKIPQKMWVGEQETVEVRLGRAATEELTQGLVGRGALSSQDIPILETMSVSLYAKGSTFEIERQSETTQLVSGGDQLKGTPFEQANYGRWIWLVTPRKTGAHMLFVRVSASLKDSRGLPTSASLPDREFPVSVSVHAGKTTIRILRRGLLGLGGAAGAGLLGAITQDLWWPKLKILLQSWGWIG